MAQISYSRIYQGVGLKKKERKRDILIYFRFLLSQSDSNNKGDFQSHSRGRFCDLRKYENEANTSWLSLLDLGHQNTYKMWYEILPTISLIYVFLTVPSFTAWGVNKLFYNRKVRVHEDTFELPLNQVFIE